MYVWAFEPVKDTVLNVVSLGSSRVVDGDGLSVDGDYYDGYAFGGLVSGGSRRKKLSRFINVIFSITWS